MFLLNNTPLTLDTPFEHEGILYPANWLRLTTIEEKNAIGITEVEDPVELDHRVYLPSGDMRDTEEVRTKLVNQYRDMVSTSLKETDWYVIRKMERGIDIPTEIAQQRSTMLSKLDTLINDLNAAEDTKELYDVSDKATW